MKALEISCRSFFAVALVAVALLALVNCGGRGNAAPTQTAAPSPYVGTASPLDLMAQHWSLMRSNEPTTLFDALDTPLANTRARSVTRNSMARPDAAPAPLVINSAVQTLDYTAPTEVPPYDGSTTAKIYPTNIDPVWSPSTSYLIFSSNRTATGTVGANFHLWAISSTGDPTTLVQLTTGAGNERWPSLASDTQLAYCESPSATGPYNLYLSTVATVNSKLVVENAAEIATGVNDVEHPSWNGDTVAFAGRASTTSLYHIYYYTVSNSLTTQLTNGPSDDENPSLSPIDGLVSFDSNASSFTYSSSPTVPGTAISSSVIAYRNIYVTRLSGANTVRLTTAAGVDNIQSAWSYVPPGLVLPTGYYIFFASDRVAGHFGIYYLYVLPQSTGGAIDDPEGSTAASGITNPAQALLTSDPLGSSPTGAYNNYEPAVPEFQQNFYDIAYASPRFIVNNIYDNPLSNANSPAYTTPNQEPTNSQPSTPGHFTPANTSLNPSGFFEILASRLFDVDPPSLLRYSTSEIIHTLNASGQTTRTVAAGGTVRFLVRLSERQTGVGQAYLQIKDPDSKYQDAAGLEHKVFTHPGINDGAPGGGGFGYLVDPTNPNQLLHTDTDEATNLFDFLGFQSPGAVGGSAGAGAAKDIGLGQLLTYVPPTLSTQTPVVKISANVIAYSTTLSLTGVDLFGTAGVPGVPGAVANVADFNHLAGAVLQLYDAGKQPTEQVQIISSNFNLSSPSPVAGTFVTTPMQYTYIASGGAAGYATIVKVGEFDPMGSEVDCQAIEAGQGGQTDATDPNSYTIPPYTPGFDDAAPLKGDGAFNPSAPNGLLWLPLTPVPATDPLFDKSGGVLYEATWQTPSTPSDYYIDAVAFSNTEANDYETQALYTGQNWRIYDNIWGFTTQPFITHTSPSGILLVNDYMLPQKFFNSERFGSVSLSNVPASYYGAESYMTDIDANWYDTKGNLAFLPSSARIQLDPGLIIETISQLFHRPTGAFDEGLSYTPYYPNGLGVNSYIDDQQQNIIPGDTAPPFPLLDNSVGFPGNPALIDDFDYNNGGVRNSNTVNELDRTTTVPPLVAPSQKYDIWRILCRGPVPSSILNAYAPQVVTQPRNIFIAGSTSKNVLVASSCVLWSSPFAGDEFADNGTIIDELYTQPELVNFVTKGGRLYVEGIDVGFALTSNGSASNTLYNSVLNAKFITDDLPADDTALILKGSGNQTDYISNDAYEDNNGNNVSQPDVGHESFKLANTTSVNVSPNWTYEPPYLGALNLARLTDLAGEVDNRSDASLNDGGLNGFQSILGFIDGFSNLLTAPPALGPLRLTAEATELHGSSASDQLVYTAYSPPAGQLGAGIAAYASFGLESLSQEVTTLTPSGAAGYSTADYTVFSVGAQRTDTLHNLICFLRTGTLTGQVTSTNGGAGEPSTEVIATPVQTGGFNAANLPISYTAYTNANGVYTISGVPAGRYSFTAYKAGTSFQHANGAVVDTHGGDTGILNLQVAPVPPGNLQVYVFSAATQRPIVGAFVTVVEAATGVALPTEITNSTGTAEFADVPAGIYNVKVTAAGFGAGSASSVTVNAGKTTDVSVGLIIAPGTISATVLSALTGAPISGAVINVTPGTGLTTTTNANGIATIPNIPAGTYTVTAAAAGYTTQSKSVAVGANETTPVIFDLGKAPTGSIYGFVSRSYDGVGIVGATVTLVSTTDPTNKQTTATVKTFTGADGKPANFAIAGIGYGTYTVSVSATGYPAVASQNVTVMSGETRVNFSVNAIHSFGAGLQLFSLPYDYTATGDTLSQIFGYSNPKLAYWEPASEAYVVTPAYPTDTIHIGLGYWARFPTPVGVLVQGTASTTATATFKLAPGWNMIGDPYATAYSLSNLDVLDNVGNTYSFANAASQGLQLVNPTLYSYNSTTNSYVADTTTLQPYVGYWIEAFSPITLQYTLKLASP